MQNELSRDFTLMGLLKFTFPTVAMLIFVATYTIVDGIFVSRYVGITALSALNIVFPLINVITGIGIMLGTGGSAIIGRRMGEDRNDIARSNFSLIIVFGAIFSIMLSILCVIFIEPLSLFLGADEELLPYCVAYGRIMMAAYPISVIQLIFQTFFVTAGKPQLGLWLNLASGLANIVLDYFFIVVMDLGIAGAAWGTACSFVIGGIPPLFYFAKQRGNCPLYFVKPKWDGSVIAHTLLNGSSEMVTSSAMAVTTFLFNIAMMRMLGQEGVAAITIILYAQFLFSSAYIGFSNGVAPIFSYTYGSRNAPKMKALFRMCIKIILTSSIFVSVFSFIMAVPTIAIFTPTDSATYEITLHGYRIFAWNFLFAGINIFGSSFFTALSNGKVSTAISFLRTFIFVTASIIYLPRILGLDGIWLAIPVAEGVTIFLVAVLLFKYRKKYQYGS